MTREELLINKELLREAAQLKKRGEFEDLFEKCGNKKITSYVS